MPEELHLNAQEEADIAAAWKWLAQQHPEWVVPLVPPAPPELAQRAEESPLSADPCLVVPADPG